MLKALYSFLNKRAAAASKDPDTSLVVWFTYDSYRKLFPGKSYEDWITVMSPYNIRRFVDSAAVTVRREAYAENKKVALVAVNEDVLNKYGNVGFPKIKNLLKRDDSLTMKILKDGKFDEYYDLFAIPVVTYGEKNESVTKTEYKIRDDMIDKIKDLLSEAYETDDIFVPGYVAGVKEISNGKTKILNLAADYFQKGIRSYFGFFDEQSLKNGTDEVDMYFIPFVIRHKLESPEFLIDNVLSNISEIVKNRIRSKRNQAFIDSIENMLFDVFDDKDTLIVMPLDIYMNSVNEEDLTKFCDVAKKTYLKNAYPIVSSEWE